MTALLSEVHALRLAMEQAATVAPRVQLTVARLNIEEQRIAQLSTQLDQARRQLTEAAARSKTLSDNLADTERIALSRTDETQRNMLEIDLREIKRAMAAQAVIEQQLRARENDAAQLLSAEQSRWSLSLALASLLPRQRMALAAVAALALIVAVPAGLIVSGKFGKSGGEPELSGVEDPKDTAAKRLQECRDKVAKEAKEAKEAKSGTAAKDKKDAAKDAKDPCDPASLKDGSAKK